MSFSYEVICFNCKKSLGYMQEVGSIKSLRKIEKVHFVVRIVAIKYGLKQ